MKSTRAGLLLLLVFAGTSASAGIILLLHYYRWASAPPTTCVTDAANPHLEFADQPEEWANLSASDRARLHFITNGVDSTGSIYDPPDGTGSGTYSTFDSGEAPYPFAYTMRWDTLQGGQTTYQSALTAMCTGDGTPTSVVVNWLEGAKSRFYRWTYAPAVDCIDTGSDKLLRFESQPVSWRNLPLAGAEYDQIYSENGAETPTGPFALPSGDGSQVYAALGVNNPAYPIHYAVRLDTIVSGVVVYQSILAGDCEADGAGTSRLMNVPEPAAASLAALGALGAVAARRGRSRR